MPALAVPAIPPPFALIQQERAYRNVKGKNAPRVGEGKRVQQQCALRALHRVSRP